MSEIDRLCAKALNRRILDEDFVNENHNDYLYVSITQPPVKVLDKKGSDDEMDWTVECPNCKTPVNYGEEIFMVAGHIYCINPSCDQEVHERYYKSKNWK